MQRYDSDRDEWTICSSPPSHINDTLGARAIAVGTNVFILGGKARLCLSYDTIHDVWYNHEQPQEEHVNGSAVLLDGKIVLSGGDDSDVIEVFNLLTYTWHTSPLKLAQPLSNHLCLNE